MTSNNPKTLLSVIIIAAIVLVLVMYLNLLMIRPQAADSMVGSYEVPVINSDFESRLARDSIRVVYVKDRSRFVIKNPVSVRHITLIDCSDSFMLAAMRLHADAAVIVIESNEIQDGLLGSIVKLTAAREVRLRARYFNCNLSMLRDLDSLESISLSNAERVTSATLFQLATLKSLLSLSFGNTSFEDCDFSELSKLPRLTEFVSCDTNFSDDDWASLRHEGLRLLVLNRCSVTDAGLACLRSFPSLRVLSLEGCDISDEVIYYLSRCPMLRHCYLFNTKVKSFNTEVFSLNSIPISCFFYPSGACISF